MRHVAWFAAQRLFLGEKKCGWTFYITSLVGKGCDSPKWRSAFKSQSWQIRKRLGLSPYDTDLMQWFVEVAASRSVRVTMQDHLHKMR
jgi:hypothetical protein